MYLSGKLSNTILRIFSAGANMVKNVQQVIDPEHLNNIQDSSDMTDISVCQTGAGQISLIFFMQIQ